MTSFVIDIDEGYLQKFIVMLHHILIYGDFATIVKNKHGEIMEIFV